MPFPRENPALRKYHILLVVAYFAAAIPNWFGVSATTSALVLIATFCLATGWFAQRLPAEWIGSLLYSVVTATLLATTLAWGFRDYFGWLLGLGPFPIGAAIGMTIFGGPDALNVAEVYALSEDMGAPGFTFAFAAIVHTTLSLVLALPIGFVARRLRPRAPNGPPVAV